TAIVVSTDEAASESASGPRPAPEPHEAGLARAADRRVVRPDHHVHFGTDAERRQVDARLDRETRAGQQPALVARLVVVDVRPRAVHIGAEAVSRAVDEVPTVARPLDDLAGGAVDL